MTPEERARQIKLSNCLCHMKSSIDGCREHRKIAEAIAEEREACAATLDPFGCTCTGEPGSGPHDPHCPVIRAAAIRARGN